MADTEKRPSTTNVHPMVLSLCLFLFSKLSVIRNGYSSKSNSSDKMVLFKKKSDESEINNNDSNGEQWWRELITIRPDQNRYPFCIVWTPLPFFTWFFPWIGHTGIALSNGIVRDFSRPYKVFYNHKYYGKRCKYWQLNPFLARGGIKAWDHAVETASEEFSKKPHYFFWSNCHTHVATALNYMQYDGRDDYTAWDVFHLFNKNFRYLGWRGFLKTWLPLTIIITFVTILAYHYLPACMCYLLHRCCT